MADMNWKHRRGTAKPAPEPQKEPPRGEPPKEQASRETPKPESSRRERRPFNDSPPPVAKPRLETPKPGRPAFARPDPTVLRPGAPALPVVESVEDRRERRVLEAADRRDALDREKMERDDAFRWAQLNMH